MSHAEDAVQHARPIAATQSLDARLLEILAAEMTSVDEVATGLAGVEACCMEAQDRRGVFATAYLTITRAIQAEIVAGGFNDPAWVARYLVSFGNLYRRAMCAWSSGEPHSVPKSWCIAFDAARTGTGFVIQHLVLGINAHINHDLALALDEVGIDPTRPAKYEDHARVNTVLEAATAGLKSEVSTKYAPILERLDWIAGRLDDDFMQFSIPKARDHAWSCAVSLAGARSEAERAILLRALDEQAAVIARLILAPPTRHPVLVRAVKAAERVDGLARRIFGF
jgi:hypothetical protein